MSDSLRHFLDRSRRDLWLLRVIAAVISLLLWLAVLGGKKVENAKRATVEYQLPKDLTIANQVPREINFRVAGPRVLVRDVEDKAKSVVVDLSNARVGDYDIPIREDMLDVPIGLKVVSISPSTVSVHLDRLAVKRVPVRAVFAGQLPDGLKVSSVTFKPSTIEVHGASQRLASIDPIPTEPIALSPNSLKQEFDVRLSTADLGGIQIDDSARVVHGVAELEGSLSRKWVRNVEIGLRVRSGSNLRIVQDAGGLGIRLRPAAVSFLLEGPDRAISKLKASDIEVWAEVGELKAGTVRARLDWRLSPELRVVRRSSDWVDVVIPPLQ